MGQQADRSPRKGWFFSLDGLDGTGKTTQCQLLEAWLRQKGLTVVSCVDPGGTTIGQALRSLLLHHGGEMAVTCEALLFMASRSQLVTELMRPALAQGQVVVSDRYQLANLVYQGHAGGLDVEQLRAVGRLATGELEPDLTVVLDLPLAVARGRRKQAADRLESRDDDYHERVRQGFLAEADRHPQRIRVVDASGSIAEVHALICKEVGRVLESGARA